MHLAAMIILRRNTLTSPRSAFKFNYNNSFIVSVCSGHREPFHRSEFCIHLRTSVLHWLAYTEWVGIPPICAQYQFYPIKTSFLMPSCSQKMSSILWTIRYFCIFPVWYTLHWSRDLHVCCLYCPDFLSLEGRTLPPLPRYAAQPMLHNPIEKMSHKSCFA